MPTGNLPVFHKYTYEEYKALCKLHTTTLKHYNDLMVNYFHACPKDAKQLRDYVYKKAMQIRDTRDYVYAVILLIHEQSPEFVDRMVKEQKENENATENHLRRLQQAQATSESH